MEYAAVSSRSML